MEPISESQPSAEAVIEVRGLSKSFGAKLAVDDASCSVRKAEVLVIIGPNGSGKSTLLRCVNLLEPYQKGCVLLDGRVVSQGRPSGRHPSRQEKAEARQLRQHVGMVFQRIHLFPHLTVMDNVMAGPRRVLKLPPEEARAVAERTLRRVDLWEKHPCDPMTLSGGQQQRAAIARALAMSPEVMLFDECTSALDPVMTKEVFRVIRQLAAEGMTMVVVTHDLGFARDVADRILFMEAGRITAEGPGDSILTNPPTSGLRRFIEQEA